MNRTGFLRVTTLVGLLFTMPAARVARAQQVASDETLASDRRAADDLLARPTTLDVTHATVSQAIDAAAASANVFVQYRAQVVDAYTNPVTLHLTNVPLRVALERILAGTTLHVVPDGATRLAVIDGARHANTQPGDGAVTGVVVDAATKQPIAGVMVSIDGADVTTRTDVKGVFHLSKIAAGTHRVGFRHIGFQATHVAVDVKDGETATVNVSMSATAQQLNDVVTTAVGERRRFEVGNVIGHLNADSIVKAQPISSVTELLANRIPGVDVLPQNGLVGAATPIRIRGLNSISLSNDPILIVDGVRQENSSGGRFANALSVGGTDGGVQSPSRVNDINPADIATIDVLKGPAAVTQYGTDAANGVIIITTKRGQAGPTRWSADVTHGWSSVPTNFPEIVYNYGHLTADPTTIVACPYFDNDPSQPSVVGQTCVIDSTLHNTPLNHPFTTIYGSGPSTNVNASMSGGNNTVTYSASAGYGTADGTVKVPDALLPMARDMGYPDELLHPNGQVSRNARASVSATPTKITTLAINAAYVTTDQRAPANTMLTQNMNRSGWRVDSTTNWGYGAPTGLNGVTALGSLGKEHHAGATFSAVLTVAPTAWFHASATSSLDHGLLNTNDYTYPSAIEVMSGGSQTGGYLSILNSTTDIANTSGYATLNLPLSNTVVSHTTGTVSYALNKQFGTTVTSYSTGSSNTLAGVSDIEATQIGIKTISAGAGVQEDLIVAQRLFLTVGFREDGATGIGTNNPTAGYPSGSISWLAVERPQQALSLVRLRGSYGASGRQPDPGQTEQVLYAGSIFANNVQLPGWYLSSVGNQSLKPERSRELEYGVDLGLFDNRINVEFTNYHKVTNDQLITQSLGLTFRNQSFQQNLGRVQNTGTELGINGTMLQTNNITWTGSLNYARNANKLLGINPGIQVQAYGVGYTNQVGYPLNSIFTQKVTYGDYNHDGMLDTSEVSMTDSNEFVGPGFPKFTLGLSSELSLLHGNVSVGASFNHTAGSWIYDATVGDFGFGQIPQNFFEQARVVAYAKYYTVGSLAYLNTTYTRWDDLHVRCTVPARLTRHTPFQSLSATFSVKNLATWTSFRGNDPTASNGGFVHYTDYSGYTVNNDGRYYGSSTIPTPRTFSLAFSSNF